MDFDLITSPEVFPGDDHNFAEIAFKRVGALAKQGRFETSEELRLFLKTEKKEYERQAQYLRGMTKYYHPNAAVAAGFEAMALGLMADRLVEQDEA